MIAQTLPLDSHHPRRSALPRFGRRHRLRRAARIGVERPRLRAEVTVTSDYVRLGDLIDGAGAAANDPVFRAPDLGTTGTVQAARVIAAAEARKIEDIDDQGLGEVAVTRASRSVSLEEMSQAPSSSPSPARTALARMRTSPLPSTPQCRPPRSSPA